MDTTLSFYEDHTQDFLTRTLSVDMSVFHTRFCAMVPPGGLILDLGCGSGRDSRFFLDQGYRVEAVDGSPALCEAASRLLGQPVRQLLFQDLDEVERYDGIWASASLLHVPSREMDHILRRVIRALKPGGALYLSVKEGDFEGERGGRYFTDYTAPRLRTLLIRHGLSLQAILRSEDPRPEGTVSFLNAFGRKPFRSV